MTEDRPSTQVAYRAVFLAAGLIVLGLLFRQLVTLLLAVLITVIIAIPLAAATDRLERRRVPRVIGALASLLAGLAVLGLIVVLLIPPFTSQTEQFVDNVPGIVDDLELKVQDLTGAEPGTVGDRVQEFAERYTDDPGRLIGPITSIGVGVAGVAGALLLILITAYFMAVNPRPLLDGLRSLAPPGRRDHLQGMLRRLRDAWLGWMQGVLVAMTVTGTLLFFGLTLVDLQYAAFFAIVSGLLAVVPYFGAFAGALLSTLFALTDSPGKALAVAFIYLIVQQVESNLITPVVMSKAVHLHPALIAIGVVLVGQLFGFVGLFVAVPILSLIVISVDEFWVKQLEPSVAARAGPELALPPEQQPEPPPREPARPTA